MATDASIAADAAAVGADQHKDPQVDAVPQNAEIVDAALKIELPVSAPEKVESASAPEADVLAVDVALPTAVESEPHGGIADAERVADVSVPMDVIPKAAVPVQAQAPERGGRDFIKRRPLIVGAAVGVLLGIVLLAARSCGTTHASAPAVSGQHPAASQRSAPAQASAQPDAPSTPAESVAVPAAEVPASATAQPAEKEAATESDDVKIQVVVKPDGTTFYYKGKVVGRTPFILKQPHEKRTYEVVKAGYGARRLVVTGNEKIIGFELQQEVPHPDSL